MQYVAFIVGCLLFLNGAVTALEASTIMQQLYTALYIIGGLLLIAAGGIIEAAYSVGRRIHEQNAMLRQMAQWEQDSTNRIAWIEAHAKRVREIYDAAQPVPPPNPEEMQDPASHVPPTWQPPQ